jgi:hypothetical protein
MNFDDLPEEIRKSIPDEHKNNAAINDVPDIPTLVKNYIESKSYVGQLNTKLESAVRVPSQDASSDDHAKFVQDIISKVPNLMVKPTDSEGYSKVFTAMGKPEKADEYTMPSIEGIPVDSNRQEMLKNLAHANNLTKDQFSGMAQSMLEADKAVADSNDLVRQEQVKSLQEKWGLAYPDHMGKAVQSFNEASGQKVESLNPEMAEVFYNVAKQLGVQAPQIGDQITANIAQGFSPAEAEIRMDEILRNKEHIMHQPQSAARDAFLENEWKELNIAASK